MDLHNFNIQDTTLPPQGLQNPMLSMHTDISSDQDEAADEVNQWKKRNLENVDSGLSTGALAPQSSDEDEDGNKNMDFGILPKKSALESQYSSETNQSSEYVDTETDSQYPIISGDISNSVQSQIKNNNNNNNNNNNRDKRHSSLLRRKSMHKWKSADVRTEVEDMQKQLKHMQNLEESALQKEINQLRDKEKRATQKQWIGDDD